MSTKDKFDVNTILPYFYYDEDDHTFYARDGYLLQYAGENVESFDIDEFEPSKDGYLITREGEERIGEHEFRNVDPKLLVVFKVLTLGST